MNDTTSAAPSDAEIDAQLRESVAKHTPGPWYSMPYSLQVTDKKMWFDEDGSRHGDTPNMILDCLTEADCHLIAAAPDLLEAAIRALRDCSDLIGTPSGDALAAAIAKATAQCRVE